VKSPICIWFTGLPGSGKTTLAHTYLERLKSKGIVAVNLDGDEIRKSLCSDLGFTYADRLENIRRVSEVNKILLDNNLHVINSFVSPTESIRAKARNIIGSHRFVLVFVDAPLAVCIERDPKGMYRENNPIQGNNFTGLGQDFEVPEYFDIRLDTQNFSIEECIEQLELKLIPYF